MQWFTNKNVKQNLNFLNSAFSDFFLRVLSYVLLNLLNTFFWSFIVNVLLNDSINRNFKDSKSLNQEFIIVIIFAPLLETLIFQYAIIDYARNKISLKASCIISALFFALFHMYNVYYFLFAFFSGLILANAYATAKNLKQALIGTFLIHSFYNLLVFGLKNLL